MTALRELLGKGGPAMVAIIALSIVLYSRCCKLLLSSRRSRIESRRQRQRAANPAATARQLQRELREEFRQQRFALGAMIAAAPLLGLLGTVSGMVKTFAMLSGRLADKSMEGMAQGISEVLVATESGLMVALPALLLVWLGHRQMERRVRELNPVDPEIRKAYR
ncbi:MAG TPA: MotA/TolQ/ExbB proton channel family protein [Opitutaceae bacterium]|nr:MotA/TolQ/ExbB proton channel family protein [Opitutaceae bacterium]